MNRNLIILLLIVLIISCEDEPTIHSREYAVVQTELMEVTHEGVRLGGRLLTAGKSDITAAGFVFGKEEQQGYRIVVKEFDDKFEYFLHSDITEGQRYFVKAWVASNDAVSYGNVLYFQSQGFVKPEAVVEQISPPNVSDGFKVLLTGKNFSLIPGVTGVRVGGVLCQPYQFGFDTLGFIMPSLSAGPHPSYLVTGDESVSFGPMNVMLPEITSYEPQQGFDGTEVTIRGRYFGNSRKVYFGTTTGILVSASDTLLIARVPNTTQHGPVSLKVDISGKQSVGGEQFTILKHTVTGLSVSSAKVGESMDILGSMFIQPGLTTTVYFDNVGARILSLSDGTIKVRVPDITSVNPLIRVIVGSKEVSTAGFTRIDSWQRIGDFPGVERVEMEAVSVNSAGYLGLGYNAGAPLSDWWKFNPVTDTWTRMSDFPGGARWNAVSFVIGTKVYVGYGTNQNRIYVPNDLYFHDFWAYDTETDQWSEIADPPLNTTSLYALRDASAVAYQNKGYVKINEKLLIYDPATDQWTESVAPVVTHYTFTPDIPFCFNINDRLFWFFGFQYGGYVPYMELYEYEPDQGRWTQLRSYTNADVQIRTLRASFVLDNMGIFGGGIESGRDYPPNGYFWMFDPATYEMTQLERFPRPVGMHAGFAIDGKGYVGMGIDYSHAFRKDFYIFDPF